MKSEKPNRPTGIIKEPIAVVPECPRNKLHPLSLVNFGKVYTVEHSVKVKPVGRISDGSMPYFLAYVEKSLE